MASKITQAKLSIGGITCMQCQKKIENRLRSTKGILKVSVSYTKGTADILYDAGKHHCIYPPSDAGAFQYTCWMGMIRGNILVTDGSTDASSENVVYSAETNTVPYGLPSCCQ